MGKYRLTNKAVDDLTQIWKYTIDKWSEHQADKYYQMLLNNFDDVANNPDLGKIYFEVKQDLFGYKAGRHIIFYLKIGENEIEIIRILHEKMDLKNRMNEK